MFEPIISISNHQSLVDHVFTAGKYEIGCSDTPNGITLSATIDCELISVTFRKPFSASPDNYVFMRCSAVDF